MQANYNVNDFQSDEKINLQFSTAENAISDVKYVSILMSLIQTTERTLNSIAKNAIIIK